MKYLLWTQIGFIGLSLICLGALYIGLRKVLKNQTEEFNGKAIKTFLVSIGLWIIVLSVLSLTGFIGDFSSMPPKFIVVLVVPIIGLVFLHRSKTFKQIIALVPHHWLVLLQSFRIAVEILLWLLFLDNIAPVQMTFEGRNLDILVGLTAPIAALLFFKKNKIRKWGGVIWNVLGLALLLNIILVALLSTPTPLRIFMNEPANTIVTKFPIVFLPGILVPLAYYLHFFSLKKLFTK